LAWTTHHIFKETKFTRKKADHTFASPGGTRNKIEFKRPNTQYGAQVFGRTPQERFKSGNELEKRKRLGQVVIASCPQSAYAVVDGTEGTENEGGCPNLLFPQGFDNGEAIYAGQHSIDNQDVRLSGARFGQAIRAVGSTFNGIAAPHKFFTQFGGHLGVILNEEHSRHVCFR
jgi:hypothetical protein